MHCPEGRKSLPYPAGGVKRLGVVGVLLMALLVPAAHASDRAVLAFGEVPALAGTVPDRTATAFATPSGRGLYAATTDGSIVAFGEATQHGDAAGIARSVVAGMATPTGGGYWLVGRDGGVFAFGDAGFHGSLGATPLNQPIVAAAATPSGRGYWLVAADGGVFGFGDARYLGGLGDTPLNQPIVGATAAGDGGGYWLVARDGGVFAFGTARFHGGLGDVTLNDPIVAMAVAPRGAGYWLLGRDGGVFAFGDAPFHGSAAGRLDPRDEAAAIVPATPRQGYWVVPRLGAVRVAVAGDVHGERHVGDRARAGLPLLGDTASVLAAADVAAVNLETPVGPPGAPQAKQYVFLAPTELLSGLAAEGIDVVSLANNHALDHGAAVLLRTRDLARAAGLVPVGAGATADEAYAPAYFDAGSRRIAVLGLSMVVPPGWAATASRPGVASAYDTRTALAAVRTASANADVVVVLVHWGVELARCPTGPVIRLADALHAAGADVVAGHHPHVLQGMVSGPQRVTAYSLGNFVWYHDEPPSDLTGVLEVAADNAGMHPVFHPARVTAAGTPALLQGDGAVAVRRAVTSGPCWSE